MFKKMRRSFLLINMVTITFFMFIAFGIIYATTYRDIYIGIEYDMKHIKQDYNNKLISSVSGLNLVYDYEDMINSFYYITYINNGIAINYHNLDDENFSKAYENIIDILNKKILELDESSGQLAYGDRYYYYEYNIIDSFRDQIIVLDTTQRLNTLDSMITNLTVISGFMIVLIFLISYIFTTRSIMPIEIAFKKQKQFISDASHELKTPLSVMKTNLDIIASEGREYGEDNKWVKNSQKEIVVMTRLINELLVLTRFDQVKEYDSFACINFSEMITEVILTMEGIAFEKFIIIDDDIVDDIYVMGIYDELKRLLVILLDNAVKYCNENGVIKINLKKENNTGIYLISNTGQIIDKNDTEIIFERFYRSNAERERKSGSFGLGLAIGKAIADKHGFNIKAYPENDMTNFKLTFKTINKKVQEIEK